MSTPKRDCLCFQCIHYPVCTHKEICISVFKAALDLIEPYDFISNVYAVCKHFSTTGTVYTAKAYSIADAKTGQTKA